jgi:short-subunit dehydrogenase
MLQRRRGHILWCSSGLSKITLPNFAAYSASKAMQDHFGRAMRLELQGTGVISSTVHPISTESEFAKVVEEKGGDARRVRTPKGMRQTAEHVANCIVHCLRYPRGEVWPSLPARLLLGVATAFPQFADWVINRQQRQLDEGREG